MNKHSIELARKNLTIYCIEKAQSIIRSTGIIGYADSEDAPSTYPDIVDNWNNALAKKEPVYIYNGGCDNTIYLNKEGNYSFRLWHDYVHFKHGFDLSYEGELLAGIMQCGEIASKFGLGSLEHLLMQCETIEQVEYYKQHGTFVEDQLQFALNKLNCKIL